jgi:hypothetical protein
MTEDKQERRRRKRVTSAIRVPLAIDSCSGVIIENSSAIDLSESGVRIRIRCQIATGQIVDGFLNKRPERCRVVWTSRVGVTEEVIAGLAFTRPLPDR